MAKGLDLTYSVLAQSQNEAAARLLLSALDAKDKRLQFGALRALLTRRSTIADRALIQRWHTFNKRWKSTIADAGGRLTTAIREAILSPDEQLHLNGCNAALVLREYDLIPTLIIASEDKSHRNAEQSAKTLLLLAEALSEELANPRDYRNRRDPHLVRSHVVASLEQSVARFEQHQRREIVESFLVLASHDNSVLNHILQHPHDKAYVTLLHVLSHSPRPGVIRLVLDSLDHSRAPSAFYSILARRDDIDFVRQMLSRFVDGTPKSAKSNLKRIDSFHWLSDDLNLVSEFSSDEMRGALHLTMASGMSRIRVFELVEFVLTNGEPEARREAAKLLVEFRGAEANAAIIRAVEDADPTVRAIAIGQLRERGIRGAVTTLFELVDGPNEVVSEAAKEALSEFTFERFLATFGTLDEQAVMGTGQIVKRVDPIALDALRDELSNPLRSRRIRAIHMAVAMKAVAESESKVIALLSDEDHVIRAAAAEALVDSCSNASRKALRDAILDRSEIVREAAEHTLQVFAEREAYLDSGSLALPLDSNGAPQAFETGETVS